MEAHSCSICKHTYNISSKRPLVLPCSHPFCQDCLQQKEKANDKQCIVCRKDWRGVRVANLPYCYQLLPVEIQAEKGGKKKTPNEVTPYKEVCVQHGDEYIIWCLACEVPACKKCMKLKHRNCDYMLMEEKLFISSLKDKYSKYSAQLLDNEKEQTSIRSLMEKVTLLEKERHEYQKNAKAWQLEADKILCNFKDNCQASEKANTILDLDENNCSPALDKLERKIPVLRSPLLVHIASAHQTSPKDVGAFVYALQSSVERRRGDGPSCHELQAAEARDLAIKEALTDGGDWVVSDATSAAAVQSVLQTTCFRPKKVEVFWDYVPEELVRDLQGFGNCKNYWTLDCFHHFEKPPSETRAGTSTKLSTLIKYDKWAALTQFCGHLDAAAVQKLPATIRSVGLVLRDQEDMKAVNALFGAAIETRYLKNDKTRLKWKGWTDLKLAVAKTFLPNNWKLNWTWQIYNENGLSYTTNGNFIIGVWTNTPVSLFTGLSTFGVCLHLHLPQLVPADRHWMGDLFGAMGIYGGGYKGPVKLFLPAACIDPDSVLGVLRDTGQSWEVHLPASLPQLVPRKEVAERYKGYGHSVTWDL